MRGGNGRREYVVELICNAKKEQDRLDKLKPLIDLFGITTNYFVDKSEVKGDPLYTKFHTKTTLSERSLYINFIKLIEKHKDDGMFVLFLESDVKPLKDIISIKADIDTTVKEMKDNKIDIVYLCKGHIKDIGADPGATIRKDKEDMDKHHGLGNMPNTIGNKFTDTLYRAATSRAGESILMAPRLIQKFLEYFYSRENHLTADWDFNHFFSNTPDIVVAWRVPELFEQDKSFGTLLNDRHA
jgi:hypothetical protein